MANISNTGQRAISAIVIIVIVIICLQWGQIPSLIFVGLFGALVVDEFICNFFKHNRGSKNYIFSQLLFILLYTAFNLHFSALVARYVTLICLLINGLLLIHLLRQKMDSTFLKKIGQDYTWMTGILVAILFIPLGQIFHLPHFRTTLGLMIIITAGMDTGAWFVGKKIGRNKLMPAVSPKKTIEGFWGGMVISCLLASLFYHWRIDQISWFHPLIFAFLAAVSQLGDLVQSKIKRQFNLKDSSALIPGHGGVYDRLDSLLFMAPFFAIFLDLI